MQNDSDSNRYASSVDTKIASLGDWRGECLSQLRTLIHEALPEVKEECKWIKPSNPLGVIVWSQDGMICTGESYKEKVKLTFLNGAAIDDPQQLFNASLEGKARRAIDIAEGGELDALAFQSLIHRAAEYNRQR